MNTLLLSASYEPLSTISWKEAITKWALGKIEIIEEYDDKFIRSTSLVIKVPAVVRLLSSFSRSRKKIRYSKTNVHARDRWKCGYCNTSMNNKELTIDHIIPRSQGGITSWTNVVSCCKKCNLEKGNKTPKQANMKLLTIPVEPDWIPALRILLKKDSIPQKWRSYVYW